MQKIKGIYAITPTTLPFSYVIQRTQWLFEHGVQILQYRDKSKDPAKRYAEAMQLKALCTTYDTLLIINDDVHLAQAVGADGVHLGVSDEKISIARKILGQEKIIGLSCYNALENAEKAIQAGADYIAFGSLFPSQTKPDAAQASLDLFHQIKKQYPHIPTVGIGGITFLNYEQVKQAGADAIAMISALYDPAFLEAEHFAAIRGSDNKNE